MSEQDQKDLGAYESHGGRSDLEPAAPDSAPHVDRVAALREELRVCISEFDAFDPRSIAKGFAAIDRAIDALIAAVRADSAWQPIEMLSAPQRETLRWAREWVEKQPGQTAPVVHVLNLLDIVDALVWCASVTNERSESSARLPSAAQKKAFLLDLQTRGTPMLGGYCVDLEGLLREMETLPNKEKR